MQKYSWDFITAKYAAKYCDICLEIVSKLIPFILTPNRKIHIIFNIKYASFASDGWRCRVTSIHSGNLILHELGHCVLYQMNVPISRHHYYIEGPGGLIHQVQKKMKIRNFWMYLIFMFGETYWGGSDKLEDLK